MASASDVPRSESTPGLCYGVEANADPASLLWLLTGGCVMTYNTQ